MNEEYKSFDKWQSTVHEKLRNDPLWKFDVYPKTLFIYELAWEDCKYLLQDSRGKTIAQQLIRSVGAISANIEEGYGRQSNKEYVQFLVYARGSAQETRGRYKRFRHWIPADVVEERMTLAGEIVAILTSTIRTLRGGKP